MMKYTRQKLNYLINKIEVDNRDIRMIVIDLSILQAELNSIDWDYFTSSVKDSYRIMISNGHDS